MSELEDLKKDLFIQECAIRHAIERWEKSLDIRSQLSLKIQVHKSLLYRCHYHLITCPDASELVKEIEEVLR